MLCDRCKKNPATVHIKKIEDGRKVQLDLCTVCASEISPPAAGLFGFQENFFDSISDILAGFSDIQDDEEKGGRQCCSVCGTSFGDFQKTGRMGCSECYEAFSEKLLPLLKRLQGSIQHAGKSPPGESRRQELIIMKKDLEQAVSDEEYERAAVIRDKIKEMEKSDESK